MGITYHGAYNVWHVAQRVYGNGSIYNSMWYWKGKGAGLYHDIKSENLSADFSFHPLVTGPIRSCAISTPRRAYSPTAILAHLSYRGHCNVRPTRYSFTPESSKGCQGKVSCQGHNIETMSYIERGETWYLSENPATSGVRNRTAGSDIDKALSFNHCATSLYT